MFFECVKWILFDRMSDGLIQNEDDFEYIERTKKSLVNFQLDGQKSLTNREQQVLSLISLGYQCSQIAIAFKVGESTVKKHVQSILQKLNARNGAHAVGIGLRSKLIS